MKNCFGFLLAAATALSSPVWAADDPAPIKGANDTRIRSVDYSDHMLIRLTSTRMVPVTLVYGETERPTLIAGVKVVVVTPKDGAKAEDAKALQDTCTDWCADRHANEITLQPMQADAGSMLVVTTELPAADGAGQTVPCVEVAGTRCIHHHYAYELRTRDGQIADTVNPPSAEPSGPVAQANPVRDAVKIAAVKGAVPVKVAPPAPAPAKDAGKGAFPDAEAYFCVSYTYSAEDAARAAADWRQAHKNDAANALHDKVADRLAAAQFNVPRNHNWTKNDSADCRILAPGDVSDNGQQTVLYFPMNTPASVPNRVNPGPEKTETLLDWHPEKAPDSGDLMIIHSVPQQFVLRREQMVCLIVRDPHAPWPVIPNTGTASPDVVRETKR